MKPRTFITEAFIQKMTETGSLAEASERIDSEDWKRYEPLPDWTTWTLICEEVLDTEHSDEHYERVLAELYRRGLADAEIRKMREFAWRTAGYLNFEMALWEWVSLDEKDIARSIQYLEEKGEITSDERIQMEQFLEKYCVKD